jgi:hypothetical protein
MEVLPNVSTRRFIGFSADCFPVILWAWFSGRRQSPMLSTNWRDKKFTIRGQCSSCFSRHGDGPIRIVKDECEQDHTKQERNEI